MTKSPYKRFSRALRSYYPNAAATVALVIALVGVPGVTAGGLLVTSKQIKNNSITSADLRKSAVKTTDLSTNAVHSADIQTGAVQSADIGAGEVTPSDVTMPDPGQCRYAETASIEPTQEFQKVVDLCTYSKTDAGSALEATWVGSVHGEAGGEFSGCVFQLRVDGQAVPNGGGGEVFGKGTVSVSSSSLFPGLPAGQHRIEVWARITVTGTSDNRCTVGPVQAGISQTVVVEEKVI